MPQPIIIKYPRCVSTTNHEQLAYYYALTNTIEKYRSCQTFSITVDVENGHLMIDLDQTQPIGITKRNINYLIVTYMELLRASQNKDASADELKFENEMKNNASTSAMTMEALYTYLTNSVIYDENESWMIVTSDIIIADGYNNKLLANNKIREDTDNLRTVPPDNDKTWLGRRSSAEKVGLVILCALLLLAGILPGLIAIAVIIIAQLISYYKITHQG